MSSWPRRPVVIAEPWSWRCFLTTCPERALREPALYITVEVLPWPYSRPSWHPASSFVKFRPIQHPERFAETRGIAGTHRDRVRTLAARFGARRWQPREEQLRATRDMLASAIESMPDTASRFMAARDADPLSRAANWLAGSQLPHEPLSVVSCALSHGLCASPPTMRWSAMSRRSSIEWKRPVRGVRRQTA